MLENNLRALRDVSAKTRVGLQISLTDRQQFLLWYFRNGASHEAFRADLGETLLRMMTGRGKNGTLIRHLLL